MRLVIEHVLARRGGHVQWDRASWRVRHLQLERHDLIAGAAEPLLRKWEESSNGHFLPPTFAALDDTRHGRSSRITCLPTRVQIDESPQFLGTSPNVQAAPARAETWYSLAKPARPPGCGAGCRRDGSPP